MINSGSKVIPHLLQNEEVPYKTMVQVREHGQGQILVEYKRGSELNKRMCSFVLMHVQIVLLPGSLHHSPVPAHYVMVYQAMGIGMRS